MDTPSRDPTYDNLPLFLGLLPNNSDPEQLIVTEAAAKAVFDAAAGPTPSAMKAQLLTAKLNALKFSQFTDVQFLTGATLFTGEPIETFGQAIGAADQVLDDIANGIPRRRSDIEAIKDLLDAANNGCPATGPTPTPTLTPTPTPAAAGVVVWPTIIPSGLPATGSSPAATHSWTWATVMAGALVALGGLALAAARRREQ